MGDKEDVLVRLRNDRLTLLRQAADIMQKEEKRKLIQNPEAIEKLARFYIEAKQ